MAGDQAALAEVYRRYAGLVFGLARRTLGDDSLSEEVAQDVFAFLWEQPQRFDASRGTLRSWLGMLTHRRSVDKVRSEVRRARSEARSDPALPVTGAQTEVDDDLAVTWMALRVRDALDKLPAEQRAAVELAYYGGRSYRQVAIELEIPEGTAKSRVRLAMARLEELLRPTFAAPDSAAWT